MKLGFNELMVILLIVVIVFGPTQIPKLTRMFGKSVKGFKEGLDSDAEEKKDPDGNA
ncbi:MAG: twin-arginine translocase TatA/TatE family subunit [Oscillibacter sp.]|nr:twin-arginine translocase TatA/TatE family subunit [Oscillibacter sp.]